MISTGSLSAFSASATNGVVSATPATGPRPIQQAAARSQSQAAPSPSQSQVARPPQPGAAGQSMPRGSLLDLSV